MKQILITGENSYIGNSLKEWLEKWPENYKVANLGVRNKLWENIDFSNFDVLVHLAAAVHIKETRKNKSFFYEINRDLTGEIAKKAREQGVGHFIFLSSMAVYGKNRGLVTRKTIPKPNTAYGMSKLEGELLLQGLENNAFKVSILRSPMVYGKGCKGNYVKLSKAAKRSPVFPKTDNLRSMIYIDNLTEFIRLLIDNESFENQRADGIYFPQNEEYVNVSNLVKLINTENKRKIIMPDVFNDIIKSFKLPLVEKIFFDLQYDMEMSEHELDYRLVDFEQSVQMTETFED